MPQIMQRGGVLQLKTLTNYVAGNCGEAVNSLCLENQKKYLRF